MDTEILKYTGSILENQQKHTTQLMKMMVAKSTKKLLYTQKYIYLHFAINVKKKAHESG